MLLYGITRRRGEDYIIDWTEIRHNDAARSTKDIDMWRMVIHVTVPPIIQLDDGTIDDDDDDDGITDITALALMSTCKLVGTGRGDQHRSLPHLVSTGPKKLVFKMTYCVLCETFNSTHLLCSASKAK